MAPAHAGRAVTCKPLVRLQRMFSMLAAALELPPNPIDQVGPQPQGPGLSGPHPRAQGFVGRALGLRAEGLGGTHSRAQGLRA